MGTLSRIFTGEKKPQRTASFASCIGPSYAADFQTILRVGLTRATAMGIPAAASCRNLIVNTIAGLDIERYRGSEQLPEGMLLSQPDPSTTWTSTISGTVDDLLWYGQAFWVILARDGIGTVQNPDGLPVRARRIPAENCEVIYSQNLSDYDRISGFQINGTIVDPRMVIFFDAGNEGILSYGARSLTAAIELEDAARRLSTVELPAGILQNVGHELGQDEADAVVEAFQTARRTNTIAFLQNVEYSRQDLNPSDLQLVEARAASATDVARLFQVPVSMIGASPTGNSSALLYANVAQNTAQFVQQACAPFINTIERTLSLESVTVRGQEVRFDVQAFLRTDPDAASQYVLGLYGAGVIDQTEARSYLGIAPLGTTTPDLTPGRI